MKQEKKINVLSLFDGMSCGQIALKKLGVQVGAYYASEIDKYAIKVAKENFPNIVHLGDVTKIHATYLKIDLLIGGSPCQGFSKAGNNLNFEDPRSKLFFEFVRILNECKPKYFLLENVKMKKESEDIITQYLGVKPIEINSSLVSGQSRKRLYWTNIPNITTPEDKGIVIRDILEDEGIADMVVNQGKHLYKADIKKSHCLMARDYKGFGNQSMTGVRRVGTAVNINGHDILKRVYAVEGKSPTLNTCTGGNREPKIPVTEKLWRKLTPLECERLQTVPDNYTSSVSNSQRYKMLGNGWTVDVIAHIFKSMQLENTHEK